MERTMFGFHGSPPEQKPKFTFPVFLTVLLYNVNRENSTGDQVGAGSCRSIEGLAGSQKILYAVPSETMRNSRQPSPTTSYEEAVKRIQALQALDTDEVNPLSYTSLLTHGHKTS